MKDVLKPEISLLIKLGSIAVHVDEFFSDTGHEFDKIATERLLLDPEVAEWIKKMGEMALVPLKR